MCASMLIAKLAVARTCLESDGVQKKTLIEMVPVKKRF